ncbi:chorismate mutase [Roseomonas terrae]|jgi:chorismate mutase/prephenate dehydratase|uniref:chorismate mutase n=1 Tax=Neoroseomonas terrae TaxID=424799 RepID=A0ABS5EEQ9_9PROT|nr:chorismate mutase [Neoroseomonas terrae]MBR0649152.1 chorismate mutase [Neoroseomonas terrae]
MPDTPALPPAAPEIAALRAEIDAIDDAMHDLLMERSQVVGRLAGSRAKGSGSPLRPGREAVVLRRLLARHTGPLGRDRIVRIWREVFMASTAIQGAFSVAVFSADAHADEARLTREHFGPITPVRLHPTPFRALAAVSDGEASVAVLPMPSEGDPAETAWWALLDAPRLQVVARLPFMAANDGAGALVVAPTPPDPSGEDRTLVLLEAANRVSRTAIAHTLAEAGLSVPSLLLARSEDGTLALAEIEGFLAPGDPRLAALPWPRRTILGAYAAPVAGDPA